MCTIDTVLREEYLNLALRHAAEPSSNPLAARVTRIAWHTAAAGYGSVHLMRRFWTEFDIETWGNKGGLLWLNILR